MSLQRGTNIRGWEGVTRNMAVNNKERAAWRFSMFSMMLALVITGVAAYLLSQTEIPTVSKALLGILVLLFTVVLISGTYSTMMRRATGKATGLEDENIGVETNEDLLAADAANMVSQGASQSRTLSARPTAAPSVGPTVAEIAATEAAANAVEEERQSAEVAAAATAGVTGRDGDGVVEEGKDEGIRPQGMDSPRGGIPDDLKLIKGVGPKLEARLQFAGLLAL